MKVQKIRGMTVGGKSRNVFKYSRVKGEEHKWYARTYINSKTVSGILTRTSAGNLRFTPRGKNAELVRA